MDGAELTAWVRVIGERLRAARIASKMSVRDVVAAVGVSVSSVQRSESGETDICVRMLARLCSAYGIEPQAVVRPVDPPAEPQPKGKKK